MLIHLAIIDDKPVNRQMVRDKIASFSSINLVLEARSGEDFLEQMKTCQPQPQVALVDIEMPGMNGIATIAHASVAYPEVKYMVLTVFEDTDKIFEAIKAGASGYLLKDDTATSLAEAISQVHTFNGIPMSPAIARKTFEILRQMPHPAAAPPSTGAILSDREMEILKELVSGRNYRAIGEKLFISPLTVRKHVANIYEKLHVNSRAQVITLAHKQKWV